jgi:hypothetical protein
MPNLNLRRGGTTPNLVITKLAADGTACLYTSNGTTLLMLRHRWMRPLTEASRCIASVTGAPLRRFRLSLPSTNLAYGGATAR